MRQTWFHRATVITLLITASASGKSTHSPISANHLSLPEESVPAIDLSKYLSPEGRTSRAATVYSNITEGPQGAVVEDCYYSFIEIGDVLLTEGAGILDEITFSVVNSSSSPSVLETVDLVIFIYDYHESGGYSLVAFAQAQEQPLQLSPGAHTLLTSTNLAGEGIYLDESILVSLVLYNCAWAGEVGQAGQLLYDPPTIGESRDYYFYDHSWAHVGGGLVSNLAWEVKVVPTANGACCFSSGLCVEDIPEDECVSQEGAIAWTPGGQCGSPNPCEGACCSPNADCEYVSKDACVNLGGVVWYRGQQCTSDMCLGACCGSFGACTPDTTVSECVAGGGLSWGFLAECSECPFAPLPSYFFGFQVWLGSDADPVNTATGNFHHSEADLSIAGRGRPLVFERFYNSLDPSVGPLGPGWLHTYNIILNPSFGENEVAVRWADGRITIWTEADGGLYEPSQWDLYDQLVHQGDTWLVTKKNGDVYQFDAGGRLIGVSDKNANTITLSYDEPAWPDAVTQVTDPAGRGVLSLTYNEADGLLQSVSDWTGRSVQYSYDAFGRLEHVTDVLLHTIDYTYDANGYLATINDQRGDVVVTNEYDSFGRVLHQWDGNSNQTDFEYGGRAENETVITHHLGRQILQTIHAHDLEFKKQLMIENPLGRRVDYGYWNFERTMIADRNGNVTEFERDENGNVVKAIEADESRDPDDGGETTVEYADADCPHSPTKKIDALGCVTEWTYDDYCNVISEKRYVDAEQTDFVEKTWTYNAFGQRLTETDERGNLREWVYTESGLLLEERDWDYSDPGNPALVNQTWYGHDELWRVIWVTDGRGSGPEDSACTTYYYYNDADWLTQVTGPPIGDAPHTIEQWYGYDNTGNLLWETGGNGAFAEDPNHTTRYEYDGNSNVTRIDEPLGRSTWYEYDALNRKVKEWDANNDPGEPDSVYALYEYDEASRLIRRTDGEGNLWEYFYDDQGNVLNETDPSGVTLTHDYDAMNRRIRTIDGLGHEWTFEYDQVGHLTKQINPEGNATDLEYDCLGRLTCVVEAEGGWTEYTYDEVGNLTEIEDANDNVVSIRQYDALNRLVYAEDGNDHYYEYGYDEVGNQTYVLDANGQRTDLAYDAENRLIQIDYADGTQVTYSYDDNGNRVGMTDGSGTTGSSSFTYDPLNRLLTSSDSYDQTVIYGYDAVGNRTSLTYPDDKQVTYGYDTANRLTTITDWAVPPRVTAYSYNGMRIETVTYPNDVLETRVYDLAGRLESINTEDSGGAPLLGHTWVRNGVGSPTSVSETGTLQPTPAQLITEYEYDTDNRLVESSLGTYEYDPNGNLTSRAVDGTTTTFAYDSEDRLVSQTTGGSTVQHVYDGDSYRIARIEGAGETRYVLDRGRSMSHVLCETDAYGDIKAYYILGPRLVARIDVSEPAESVHYYHTNDIGNVVALTDEGGVITDRYSYTPFGLLAHEGPTEGNAFTYVGGLGVMAEEDGLYFMRARFYDPDTGRLLGKDPVEGALGDPRGLHRYVYGLNNPALLTDSTGQWFGIDDAIAAAAGAIAGAVGTLVGDVVGIAMGTQEGFSSWQTYGANIVGGAVGGVATLYLGPGGYVLGAATSSGLRQGLEIATGERESFDIGQFALETTVQSATSLLFAKVLPSKVALKRGGGGFKQPYNTASGRYMARSESFLRQLFLGGGGMPSSITGSVNVTVAEHMVEQLRGNSPYMREIDLKWRSQAAKQAYVLQP